MPIKKVSTFTDRYLLEESQWVLRVDVICLFDLCLFTEWANEKKKNSGEESINPRWLNRTGAILDSRVKRDAAEQRL